MSLVAQAIHYARDYGWRIHPLWPRDKKPLLKKHWPDLATTDEATIRRWWGGHPEANIGIVTGADSDILVIDVDPRSGGNETLNALLSQLGPLPETFTARTGGADGGTHYYYRWPRGLSMNKVETGGVEFRGNRHNCVLPPSIHPAGREYEWTHECEGVAELPEGWLKFLREHSNDNGHDKPKPAPNAPTRGMDNLAHAIAQAKTWQGVKQGERNTMAVRRAAELTHDYALNDEEAWPIIVAWNERNDPPLESDELDKCFRNGRAYGKNEHGCRAKPSEVDKLPYKLGSDIERREIDWLWRGRIPRGKVTLFVGEPDTKKTYLTCDIAARVTSGAPWPDAPGEPVETGRVLILNAEDDADDTLLKRFDDQGGDDTRLAVVNSDIADIARFPDDAERLDRTVREFRADVVIVDPVSAFVGSNVNTWRDSDVRNVLGALRSIAKRHNLAMLGVMHVNKAQGQKAIHRISGSGAFAAAARAVFVVGLDPQDEARSIIVKLKFNIGPTPAPLAYRLKPDEAGRLVLAWDMDAGDIDADTLLGTGAGKSERGGEVDEFLRGLLADGP
ncbi:MAG: bifunctional DNA primase/polymerase, partial [Phycisphaerae bacterium]